MTADDFRDRLGYYSNKGAVSYDRLRISSDTPCHYEEEIKYLFDEKETGVESRVGTSKSNFKSDSHFTI